MADKGERAVGGGICAKSCGLLLFPTFGVTKTQSSRWQKLAAMDEDDFEARAAAARGSPTPCQSACLLSARSGACASRAAWIASSMSSSVFPRSPVSIICRGLP
jgi:hypothetical protein